MFLFSQTIVWKNKENVVPSITIALKTTKIQEEKWESNKETVKIKMFKWRKKEWKFKINA